MKRIFIAVKIVAEETMQSIILSLRSSLTNESIKWVELENIHITLAFLGDTEEDKIKIISSMLQENCSGLGDFEIILKGAGIFKNSRKPGAIWIGIQSSDNLQRLNDRIKSGLKNKGFDIEDRPFKPHLTIGRVKSLKPQTDIKNMLEKYSDIEIQKVRVKEVILFESILKPSGPLYKPISVIKL